MMQIQLRVLPPLPYKTLNYSVYNKIIFESYYKLELGLGTPAFGVNDY
jgi:hypothetical protein